MFCKYEIRTLCVHHVCSYHCSVSCVCFFLSLMIWLIVFLDELLLCFMERSEFNSNRSCSSSDEGVSLLSSAEKYNRAGTFKPKFTWKTCRNFWKCFSACNYNFSWKGMKLFEKSAILSVKSLLYMQKLLLRSTTVNFSL